MISRQEFEQLRQLIVMTREHFDQLVEYLDAHFPEENAFLKDVRERSQTVGSMTVLPLKLATVLTENPLCDNCGSITMRCGTCYRCYNCGTSLGCS